MTKFLLFLLTAQSQKSNQGVRFWDTLSGSTYTKHQLISLLPSHEEEQRDRCTLSNVGAPRDRNRATQDNTVWIVDLAEFVGSETYVKLAVSKTYRRKHHRGVASTRVAGVEPPTG